MADTINIEVVYALPEKQTLLALEVPLGTTLQQAVELSGILQQHPEIEITAKTVGIFSQKKPLDHVLGAGERVEIYRPLIADPKEVRRRRAKAKSK